MKRRFSFYLDDNSNLHVKEEGTTVIQYVQYPLWIKKFIDFENEIDTLNSLKTYPIEEFVEFRIDKEGFIKNTFLERKTMKELLKIIENYKQTH